jgi:hypothetical protein
MWLLWLAGDVACDEGVWWCGDGESIGDRRHGGWMSESLPAMYYECVTVTSC